MPISSHPEPLDDDARIGAKLRELAQGTRGRNGQEVSDGQGGDARDAGQSAGESQAPSLDALFGELEERIGADREGWLCRLREQSTLRRRLIGLGSFAVLALIFALTASSAPLAERGPLEVVASLGSFAVLLGTALWLAFRPVYLPSLSAMKVCAVTVACLAATLIIAFLPVADPAIAAHEAAVHPHAVGFDGAGCLMVGLLAGFPVYAVARALDRGSHLSSVLAAAAAGLAGNFFLQLHCPLASTRHQLMGHVPVLVGFVFGALLVHFVELRVKARRSARDASAGAPSA